MTHTQSAWKKNEPLFESMVAHPFNQELAAGTLSRERFCYYMIQDAHYVDMFSKSLAVVSAKAPHALGQTILSYAAHDTFVAERELHDEQFGHLGFDGAQVAATPLSPTCLAYGHFLVATAHTCCYATALWALLPSFQVNWEVGKRVHENSTTHNPYRKWIDTFVDDEYANVVTKVIDLSDETYNDASQTERAAMHTAYMYATRLEWMFWDSAYRMEEWPFSGTESKA